MTLNTLVSQHNAPAKKTHQIHRHVKVTWHVVLFSQPASMLRLKPVCCFAVFSKLVFLSIYNVALQFTRHSSPLLTCLQTDAE